MQIGGNSIEAANRGPIDPSSLEWHKSRRSNPSGNCVELADLPDGSGFAMRNSRDPEGAMLIFTYDEIAAFVGGAKDGDFDHLLNR